jgi:Ca2+-binding RTX toxin-like protein
LSNVLIDSNIASYNAGGIFSSGTISLLDVTVSRNKAGTFNGGIDINRGTASLNRVTISSNNAGEATGGIAVDSGLLTLTNVTIAQNTAGNRYGAMYVGDSVTCTNVTISGNTAPNTGGVRVDGALTIANSIIAGNSDSAGYPDVRGAVSSLGNNLIARVNGSSGWNAADLSGTASAPLDAKLGLLTNNGGLTQTMLPQSNSVAINNGLTVLVPAGVTVDQRGAPRVVGGTVDIGAVEVQPSTPLPAAPTALQAVAVSASQVNLTWSDNASNETGYKVERATAANGTWNQIGTLGSNARTYSSTGLLADTPYWFRVRATNAGGDSAFSNVASARTLATPSFAALVAGVLTVTGTASADTIRAVIVGANTVIRLNELSALSFPSTSVTKIVINAGAGNDSVFVSSAIAKPVTINGGDGNDYLIGGGGANTINGNAGTDIGIRRLASDIFATTEEIV